jgi:nicotinate-nucleotide pyrophosphorylase (carboxylating)
MANVTLGLARLPAVERLIDLAIDEDLGRGDVTTAAVIDPSDDHAVAVIVAREELVVFALDVAMAVFERVDPDLALRPVAAAGQLLAAGDVALEIEGSAASILVGERTALNFMRHLSGIATMARRFAGAVAGTEARVLDTRKTTPGYRVLEKAAVVAGGCHNHRSDLGSGILIKDNHIAACGSVAAAVERARARAPHPFRIEVEVTDFAELEAAIGAGAEVVLLDNMSVAEVERAVRRAHEDKVLVEVSGGITLDCVAAYARAGADLISSGALTHSAGSVDLALDFRSREE